MPSPTRSKRPRATPSPAGDSTAAAIVPPRRVPVALGARSYDIVIGTGLLVDCDALMSAVLGKARLAVVTDETVARLHLPVLEKGLGKRLLGSVSVPAGEASKSFSELARVSQALLSLGLERGDAVIAFGGGVVGDLAGFAASILRRGVRLVQIPTTLLAQVDSSVGGKTGINTPQGKNLIGTFHQPVLVLADTDVLQTLPARELRAGYAEVAKYGLLGDKSFFEWLERHAAGLLSGEDAEARIHAIETSCRAKATIVARDETETGDRALLNLGHTFGHALEAWAGYSDQLLHGEAVAIGMVLAFRYSESLGQCSHGLADRVEAHLAACGLPTAIRQIPRNGSKGPAASELLALMAQDKKVKSGKPTLILVKGIGEAFISRDQSWDALAAFLERHCR